VRLRRRGLYRALVKISRNVVRLIIICYAASGFAFPRFVGLPAEVCAINKVLVSCFRLRMGLTGRGDSDDLAADRAKRRKA
jgi:hypothetical protein